MANSLHQHNAVCVNMRDNRIRSLNEIAFAESDFITDLLTSETFHTFCGISETVELIVATFYGNRFYKYDIQSSRPKVVIIFLIPNNCVITIES